MKKLLFFSTKPRVFWVELPPIILLIPSIIFNSKVNTLMRLYPLIFALSGITIFFALYFYRAVSLSYEEIKCIGLFSTKDKAVIKEDRALVITFLKKRRVRLEVFGKNDDGEGSYSWLRNDEPAEINLFRAKINGGTNQAKKILRYFKVDEAMIDEISECNGAEFDSAELSVSTKSTDELKEIRIYFKKTI